MKLFKNEKLPKEQKSNKYIWMLLQLFISITEPISNNNLTKTNSIANPYFNNKFINMGSLKN